MERPKIRWWGADFRSLLSDAVYYGLLIAVLVLHIVVNRQAGNSYPTPWPDEAHFLWQAHSVATQNTLFSEELCSDRTIMWQPPGYFVFVGIMFKVMGTSLESGRLISLLLLIGAFVVLVRLMSHCGNRWPILVLSGLFFLNGSFIACGNVARMEALLLLLVFSGFFLIQRGKPLPGLALLAVTPVIHFNGLYFCLFGLVLVVFRRELSALIRPFTGGKLAVLVVVAAIWLGYIVLIAGNWDSFAVDMKLQFGRKGGRSIWPFFVEIQNLLLYLIILVGVVIALKTKSRAVELLFLAVPSWAIYHVGREIWYAVMEHTGHLLMGAFVLHLWLHLCPIKGSLGRRLGRVGLTVAVLVILIGWNYRSGRIENLFDYHASVDFLSLGLKGGAPYLTHDDQTRVTEILDSLATEQNHMLVEFQPDADAFYFLELQDRGVEFTCSRFQSEKPDLLIVHISRHLPRWWRFGDEALARTGLTRDSTQYVLYQRDLTEKWYFVDVSH